ncbi:cysteine desulfurase family protein [Pelagibius sp. Alg239-R121]|uniref:cysteine desulfurase family protein n=1 Tax=Pelagibius sp. Alg239-R121 TaxID=2993448 RepID=UPI0024A6304C|nr:cysteine desulfurase family protein [Pelagibius sp. Alg239-R121]
MPERIYLDYQATTPLDPRVRDAMLPYFDGTFGNPHSEHVYGWEAASAVNGAAGQIADLIGATPSEIIFTSGATEANNLAIMGWARSKHRRGHHIITTAIEHKCVLNTAAALVSEGFIIEVLPVDQEGRVDPAQVQTALREDTALVSVMTASNEIGTIQPITEIGEVCRAHGVVFHTDAAQALGKLPIDVTALNVDLLSMSSHKLYGPKGIGALYVSDYLKPKLAPLILGGAQQDGLRAGTLAPMLCAGFGEACRIAAVEMEHDDAHCRMLKARFKAALEARLGSLQVNGNLTESLPTCLNVRLPTDDAQSIVLALEGCVAASNGSACNSGLIEPSYVLTALGLTFEEANASLRFGFGRGTTENEVDRAANLIASKVEHFNSAIAAE